MVLQPSVGQEFANPIGGVGRQPLQDDFEVSERINLMRLQLPAMPYKMAAFLFSVVGSCKRLGLDTYAYLRDVLGQLRTPPAARLAEISPDAWFAVHPRARRKIAS